MLLYTCCHGKNVRVKNNVFRRETDFFSQELICSCTDFYLTVISVGLPHLIKGHDNHGCAVASYDSCMIKKLLHTFFHGNGVYDTLSLNTLKSRLNDFPFGRVNHNRYF